MAGYASPSTRALLAALIFHPTSIGSRHQGIIGNVTMDFWGVICTTAQSVPTKGPDLTITSNNGRTLVVPLSWTLHYPCIHMASFLVDLNPRTYSVTLSPEIHATSPSLTNLEALCAICPSRSKLSLEPIRILCSG